MLFFLACTTAPQQPLFTPRRDLAGRIETPFGALRSAGIQHLCKAPEVRIGTVIDVAEPALQSSGLRTQRLTLEVERTLRGEQAPTFAIDTTKARQHAPTPGPGRYLLATSTTPERITLWAVIDVAQNVDLTSEERLRADLNRLCEQARRWPEPPFGRFEP